MDAKKWSSAPPKFFLKLIDKGSFLLRKTLFKNGPVLRDQVRIIPNFGWGRDEIPLKDTKGQRQYLRAEWSRQVFNSPSEFLFRLV